MKCIKELVEKIYEEIDDAESYAELTIQYATEDRALADTYITLAKEEVTHMNRLHEQVMRVIAEYRNKNGEPPQAMTDIYNWEHKRIVKQAAQVQVVINSYK